MKQLSKDYRLVILATILGALVTLFIIQLPELIIDSSFWFYAAITLVITILAILLLMLRNTNKLSKTSEPT